MPLSHTIPKPNSSHAQCAKCATASDACYKNALVEFFQAKTWHWSITIPIGLCADDDAVLRQLRLIEAILNGRFLTKRFHHLPDDKRFSMAIAFEGEHKLGTRHAHVLVHVPAAIKRRISRSMLIALLPQQFRFLWVRFQETRLHRSLRPLKSYPWEASDFSQAPSEMIGLHFQRATPIQVVYAVKSARLSEVPWSRVEFVTPPKTTKFDNENLSAIKNKDKQRRRLLGLH
jgi:hypothetical protein